VQAAINTQFGELYAERGEVPEWQALVHLRGDYPSGTVPPGVVKLVLACDVQKSGIWYAVRGWGAHWESWLIEYGYLHGETGKPDIWRDLSSLRHRTYDGRVIDICLIDSGYEAPMVYQFAKRHVATFPTKGWDKRTKPVEMSRVEVHPSGKTNISYGSVRLWNLDSDYMKSWVHTRLSWPPGQPGAWHVPQDCDAEYFQQLTNESRIISASGRVKWRVHGPNHLLDCEALSVAGAHILNVGTLRPSLRSVATPAKTAPAVPYTVPASPTPVLSQADVDKLLEAF
jgi:phage terminase large subunit GpA-like protein